MPEKNRRLMDLTATFLMAAVFLASPVLTYADSSVGKLNEDPIKCTPCIQNPPPPPPSCSSPSPPPPQPSPPPTPKKSYCPPPPKESYFPPPLPPPTYVYGSPPGDLYPVDHDFGAAAAGESFTTVKLIALGFIGFMIL